MTTDPLHKPPRLTTEHADRERQFPPTAPKGWARIWPSLLAALTLPAVGGPAAIASYRHARDVITEHGDPVMAPWLALTTDGMLLAALVVIWVRRHRHEPVGAGPWAAFWAGMTATIAANLAAAQSTPIGIVVALWPPICLAITLELIALIASPTRHDPVTDTSPADEAAHVPDHAQPAPGHTPAAVTGLDDRARATGETGQAGRPEHDTGTERGQALHERHAADRRRVPATVPAGTNGHGPGLERAVPTPDLPDLSTPAGPAPTDTCPGSGINPGHEAAQNGHHDPAPPGPVPDGHILAWLRERARTTGQVPGRRKVIEKWALGSTRAERLRGIVIDEAASQVPASAGDVTGHTPRQPLVRLGPLDPAGRP